MALSLPGSETHARPVGQQRPPPSAHSLGPRARLDLAYGPAPRNRFDLFLPEAAPQGLMVFVHGGYWLETDKSLWSHLAAGALARGWACALPGYTLAPQARIAQITAEVDTAITAACSEIAGPLVVTGHSAGGHLAARMGNTDRSATLKTRLNRVVPISPLADLEPLSQTDMQADLHLDAAEIAARKPRPPRPDTPTPISGSAAPNAPPSCGKPAPCRKTGTARWTVDPGTHHYNVIDALEDPNSALMRTCLDGL